MIRVSDGDYTIDCKLATQKARETLFRYLMLENQEITGVEGVQLYLVDPVIKFCLRKNTASSSGSRSYQPRVRLNVETIEIAKESAAKVDKASVDVETDQEIQTLLRFKFEQAQKVRMREDICKLL